MQKRKRERLEATADVGTQSLAPILADQDGGVAEALRRDAQMDKDPSQVISLEELDSLIRERRNIN